MIIKKYLAKTEKEAIEMAKDDLGSSAVVMNIKKIQPKGLARFFVKSKVEVTAALEENKTYAGSEAPKSAPAGEAGKHFDAVTPGDGMPPMPSSVGARGAAAAPKAAPAGEADALKREMQKPARKPEERTVSPEQSIQDKLKKLETLLEKQMEEKEAKKESVPEKTEKEPDKKQQEPENDENEKTKACKDLIYKQLLEHEVDKDIADAIMDEINTALPANAALDQILASVYQRIILMIGQPYLIDTKPSDKTKFIFFLGSTGVGKTTTIAKIASRLKLDKKANVALVTADTYRIAAVEQLKTYANILSVPLTVVYSPEELGGEMENLSQYDYCLIDTAGRSHKNDDQIRDIRELIEQVPVAERQVYLVLNAGTKYSDLKEIASVYSKMTDYSIIFTKLDETSSAGVMLNMRMKTKCPLSYVTWGQNVPEDIGEIDAQKVAKQLLGGDRKE